MTGMKTCIRCRGCKPLLSFCVSRNSKDGRHYYCSDCMKQYARDLRERNRPIKPTVVDDGRKLCTSCGDRKLIMEFYAQRGGKYGVGSQCKMCLREMGAKRRAEDREAARESIGSTPMTCFVCHTARPVGEFLMVRNKLGREYIYRKCSTCREDARMVEIRRRANKRKAEDARKIARLDDRYVRVKLASNLGLAYAEIPEEIVQLKRVQLETKRMSRKLRRALDESSQDTR